MTGIRTRENNFDISFIFLLTSDHRKQYHLEVH